MDTPAINVSFKHHPTNQKDIDIIFASPTIHPGHAIKSLGFEMF